MEDFTEKEAEARAYACARELTRQLDVLNAQVAELEKEQKLDVSRGLDFLALSFLRVIGERYVIKPD
jgi:hypothetical protein